MEVFKIIENKELEKQTEYGEKSTLRIVSKRENKDEPFTVNIPVKENKFSLVLPNGSINWPEGRPYPDPIRVRIDEEKSLWLNFGVSNEYGFFATLNISEHEEE